MMFHGILSYLISLVVFFWLSGDLEQDPEEGECDRFLALLEKRCVHFPMSMHIDVK